MPLSWSSSSLSGSASWIACLGDRTYDPNKIYQYQQKSINHMDFWCWYLHQSMPECPSCWQRRWAFSVVTGSLGTRYSHPAMSSCPRSVPGPWSCVLVSTVWGAADYGHSTAVCKLAWSCMENSLPAAAATPLATWKGANYQCYQKAIFSITNMSITAMCVHSVKYLHLLTWGLCVPLSVIVCGGEQSHFRVHILSAHQPLHLACLLVLELHQCIRFPEYDQALRSTFCHVSIVYHETTAHWLQEHEWLM